MIFRIEFDQDSDFKLSMEDTDVMPMTFQENNEFDIKIADYEPQTTAEA